MVMRLYATWIVGRMVAVLAVTLLVSPGQGDASTSPSRGVSATTSAVSAMTSVVTDLNAVDQDSTSIASYSGWERLLCSVA